MIELGQGGVADTADLIKDSTERTFMADVIETSQEVPVIVDFWATWCGPCKALTPALEAAVKAANGKVKLVKVDVDQNQMIAQQLRIQSIPTVYGFVNGQPVDAFQGNQTPSQIQDFIKRLIAMSPAGDGGVSEMLDAADAHLAQGAVTEAAQGYAAVLGQDRTNLRALAGFVRAHLAMGDVAQAKAVLEMVPPEQMGDPAIAGVLAEIELLEASADAGDLSSAEAAVDANPDDHQARFDLAMSQIAKKDHEGAVETLLELFRRDREWNDGAAKEQLLKLLDSLGPKSEIAQKGRRRLSSMIFA